MQRARAGRALTGVVVGWVAACAGPEPDHRRPDRVASFVPAATEITLALGAGDRLVARAADDPTPGALAVPPAGTVLAPDLEQLALLGTDLVLVAPESEHRVAALRRTLGARIEAVSLRSLSDVAPTVRALGTLLGREPEAGLLAGSIERELESVARRATSRPTRSVLWVVSATPLVAAGPGTHLDDLGALANLRNVLGDDSAGWPVPAFEVLVRRDPDLVLWVVAGVDPPGVRADHPWNALSAVRAGRVVALDPHLFLQPGPRVGAAGRRLLELHSLFGLES